MKQALVIHPRFTIYGGGEMGALHVIKTLQDLDYNVSIATDNYNPVEVEKNLQMGKVMEKCTPIRIPPFRPLISRFLAIQHLRYAPNVVASLKKSKPDLAFSTQSILYHVPGVKTFHIVYDMADLFEIPKENVNAAHWLPFGRRPTTGYSVGPSGRPRGGSSVHSPLSRDRTAAHGT